MNVRTTNRLYRAAAATIGALSIAGLALAGTGTASAEPTTAAGPAAASEPVAAEPTILRAAARPQDDDEEEDELCLSLSMMRYRDTDCGRLIQVEVRGMANGVGIRNPEGRSCVSIPRYRECAGEGEWASVRTRRGGFEEVSFYSRDPRLCGRAASDGDWGSTECTDRRGWLRLEADDDIDELRVWIMRGRPGGGGGR